MGERQEIEMLQRWSGKMCHGLGQRCKITAWILFTKCTNCMSSVLSSFQCVCDENHNTYSS